MKMFAAAARRRRGELADSARGQELVAETDELMRAHGIHNPARMTDILAPFVVAPRLLGEGEPPG